MRSGGLALAVVLLLVAGGAARPGSAKSASGPSCVIRSLEPLQYDSYAIRGACTAGGKRVAGTFHWSYESFDAAGVSCFAAREGAGARVSMASPGYRTKVIATLTSAGAKATTTRWVVTGFAQDRCASLADFALPAASALCPVPDTQTASSFPNPFRVTCGTPALSTAGEPLCAWVTPIVKNGSTIAAGSFACASGKCTKAGSTQTDSLFGAPLIRGHDAVCNFRLNIGYEIGVEPWLAAVRLTDRAGRTCQWPSASGGLKGMAYGAREFRIPATWGGTLTVTYLLRARAIAIELSTAQFALSGSAGCESFNP
jgi:hypothetical protein